MRTSADVARQWFREVWEPGGEATVDDLLAADAEGWMEGRKVTGRADFKDARRELLETFPDLTITVEDLVAQDDRAAVRWRVTATHRGKGLGIPATNRRVEFRGMSWLEVRDGKVVRGWDAWNLGALIQSLNEERTPQIA